VALQDVAPIAALTDGALRALAATFTERGLRASELAPIVECARALHPLLRRPAHLEVLRRASEPWAPLARAFMFSDPVDRAASRGAGLELEPLVESGLLREEERGLVSPFAMAVADGLYVLSDPLERGVDAVMGLGPLTTPSCAAVRPLQPIGRAFDLGCGARLVALLLSRRVRSVVATDINPRAVAMARLNARINGIGNVDVRKGSLFEPVASERFDLVASQPPFIPASANAERIDARLRAIDAVDSRESLSRATLRRVPGLVLVRGDAADGPAVAELPSAAMSAPVSVEAEVAAWIERFGAPARVDRVIAEVCLGSGQTPEQATRTIASALVQGLLELVD
jgi:SAM-dependent methyltransferase